MNSDDLPRQPRIAVNLWNSGLIDISAGGAADTDRAQLEEFVDRSAASELWMLDKGLWRVDYRDATQEKIELGWEPKHIGILPEHDYIVIDQSKEQKIHFIDPDTAEVHAEVPLPRDPPRNLSPIDEEDSLTP